MRGCNTEETGENKVFFELGSGSVNNLFFDFLPCVACNLSNVASYIDFNSETLLSMLVSLRTQDLQTMSVHTCCDTATFKCLSSKWQCEVFVSL